MNTDDTTLQRADPSHPLRIQHAYAGAEWIESNVIRVHNTGVATEIVEGTGAAPMSPLGRTVADVLGFVYRGIYHLPNSATYNTDWSDLRRIVVNVPAELCTWDGNTLTQLVVVTHDMMLRMEVGPSGPRMIKLSFFQRMARDGDTSLRLPTLEEHVGMIRQGYVVSFMTDDADDDDGASP